MARDSKKATKRATPAPTRRGPLDIDYRNADQLPAHVREKIAEEFALESESARADGRIGFMARALVIATMPYKDVKDKTTGKSIPFFERHNGDFELRMVAGYRGGLPYGIYPRLLMGWLTTEAVRTREREIELGHSLASFLRDAIDVRSTSGGKRGTGARVSEQMKRLFGSLITASYRDKKDESRSFSLRNVLVADALDLYEEDENALWRPQSAHEVGQWRSRVVLNEQFFREITDRPVPISTEAYRALRSSPMAMDLYQWLTYRMSYHRGVGAPISYEYLLGQFGSQFTGRSAVSMFKRQFLKSLELVQTVYPDANLRVLDKGVQLVSSKTHVPKLAGPNAEPKKKDGAKPARRPSGQASLFD